MFDMGNTCYVKRDIHAGGKLIFKEGEIVTIERISPHARRPEYKYVVFSVRAGKYFLLSEMDLSAAADTPSKEIETKTSGIPSTERTTRTLRGSDDALKESKTPGISHVPRAETERISSAPGAFAKTETPASLSRTKGKRVPLPERTHPLKSRAKMSKRSKILLPVLLGFAFLMVVAIFFTKGKERTTLENTLSTQNHSYESETEPESPASASSFEGLISIENLVEGQKVTAGTYTVSGRFLLPSSLNINGVPVGVAPGTNEFHHPVTINEGENALLFVAVDEKGKQFSKEVRVTGVLSPEMYKASCPPGPPYSVLKKNPEAYKGTRCHYRGKVVQAMESMGTTMLRVDITHKGYGFWDDTIYVTLGGSTPAVEDSMVVVYGTIAGSYTYQSIAGWTITLPWIMAEYVDVVG